MKRQKKQFPEDFKTKFGFSTMMFPVSAATIFMTTFFMQYLTDYSGIDMAIGKVGFAAAFGTALLLIARVVDIIDDPLQAWVMDNAKEGKLGKYRKFAFLNIILVTLAMICIFSIPNVIKSNRVLLCVWVSLFYLMYEMGTAFTTSMPLLQKTTLDPKIRSKLSLLMRVWMIVILVPVYFYIPVVTAVDQHVENIGKSFSMVCIVLMSVLGIVAFFGVLGLKEKRGTVSSEENAETEKLKIGEVLRMFLKNKPFLVHAAGSLLSGLVFGLFSVVSVYFLKWYYAANLTTGEVYAVKYAEVYGIFMISALIPNFVSPFLSNLLVKKSGNYAHVTARCFLFGAFVYIGLTVLFFTGILKISPYIYVAFNFLSAMATGTAVIPQTLLWTECADYAELQTGKKMSALINSASNMLNKALNALSSVVAGGILIAVGYSVNNETGHYAGDVSQLPKMINGFALALTVIPIVVMILAYLLYRFQYPITPEIQKDMVQKLAEKAEAAEEN